MLFDASVNDDFVEHPEGFLKKWHYLNDVFWSLYLPIVIIVQLESKYIADV